MTMLKKWDKDLKIVWWIGAILAAGDVGAAIRTGLAHQWSNCANDILWAGNVVFWMYIIGKMQQNRDRDRESMREIWKSIMEAELTAGRRPTRPPFSD